MTHVLALTALVGFVLVMVLIAVTLLALATGCVLPPRELLISPSAGAKGDGRRRELTRPEFYDQAEEDFVGDPTLPRIRVRRVHLVPLDDPDGGLRAD